MSSGKAYVRTQKVSAYELGLNGVTFTAAAESDPFSIIGINQLVAYVDITQVAASDIQMHILTSPDNGVSWGRMQSGSISSGTETDVDHTIVKALTTSIMWVHPIPIIGGEQAKLSFIGTSAGATDLITVTVFKAVAV